MRVAYKVLRNFKVSSARLGAIVGNHAVVLVAKPYVARALAVLERAGMRAVRDSALRSKELPRSQSVLRDRKMGPPGINERQARGNGLRCSRTVEPAIVNSDRAR